MADAFSNHGTVRLPLFLGAASFVKLTDLELVTAALRAHPGAAAPQLARWPR